MTAYNCGSSILVDERSSSESKGNDTLVVSRYNLGWETADELHTYARYLRFCT
jgi:hypothetical protein